MALNISEDVNGYCGLFHREVNPNALETIVLTHGAFGDGAIWHSVVRHLPQDYHLLIPDLPTHGIASHIKPFSIGASAHLLSELILRRAHEGKAKVVGHSLGADVALRLASEFPQVVDGAIFVSGASTPQSASHSPSPYLPYAAWAEQRIEWAVPRSFIRYLMDSTDMPRPNLAACSLELNQQIFAPLNSKSPSAWPARTMIVAAGKGGFIPSQDNADTARKLAEIGRRGNGETLAVVHSGMRHPWNLQDPNLFTAAIDA